MAVAYEWVVETLDDYDDIQDLYHADTFARAMREAERVEDEGGRVDIALTRLMGDEAEGLRERQYAYLEDGRLPDFFEDGARVPARFHQEVASLGSQVELRKEEGAA